MNLTRISRWPALAALGTSLLFASVASAADGDEDGPSPRARLEAASSKLAELETREFHDDFAQDFGSARLAIGEIQTALASEQSAKALITLSVLEARVLFIESAVDRALVDDLATKRESDNIAIQTEADEMQLQLETLSLRRGQLQEQVRDIVKAVEDQQQQRGSTPRAN